MIEPKLRPPDGYTSWLQYAIDTMDTRSLYHLSMGEEGESPWGREVQREEMREAANAEKAELVEALRTMRIFSTCPHDISGQAMYLGACDVLRKHCTAQLGGRGDA